jgi:hypothetical protein
MRWGCTQSFLSPFFLAVLTSHLQYGQVTLVGTDKTNSYFSEVHVHSFGTSDLIHPGDKVGPGLGFGWWHDGGAGCRGWV